jgi:antitoxin component YwqK of YwqJK toxin-antitoxin module
MNKRDYPIFFHPLNPSPTGKTHHHIITSAFCLLLSAFCLLPFAAFTQESPNPNGYNIFYYPNGAMSSEGHLVNGKPDGYWKSYNEKGTLISEGNRKNFLLDSVWVFYAPSGEKTMEISYSESKKHGYRKQFFEDEKIVEEWKEDTLINAIQAFYLTGELKRYIPVENGKAHGLEKEFNKEGLIIVVSKYFAGILGKREFINRTDKFGLKQGSWKYFWDNGNLKEEGSFLKDKKKGYFKYYDEDGNFKSVEKYDNDNLVVDAPETRQMDVRTVYHPNGKPAITATYYKGVPDGIRREFDEDGLVVKGYVFANGIVKYEGITDENGKRQGLWKEYYLTGELKSQGHYINSNQDGAWKFYFENQKIEVEGVYKNGKKEGAWYWYYPKGALLQEENWSNGKWDGEFVEYNEIGEITVKGEYVEGTEEGEWYYIQGHAIEKGVYYDGMKTGLWTTKWRSDDKLISEIEYDQNLFNGKYNVYYHNGQIKETGKYSGGERVGIWYLYSEEGELLLTTVYEEGREIRWDDYRIEE